MTEKLIAFESANASELTEQESSLTSGHLSAKEIREKNPTLYILLQSQGLVKEDTEEEKIYTINPGFFGCYEEENLEILKVMAALTIYGMDPALSRESTESGKQPTMVDFLNFVPRALPEQAYVHNYVPKDMADMYPKLAEEYREAMRERIRKNTWMEEGTKTKAYEKLDKLVVAELLYPYGEIDCESIRNELRSSQNLLEAAAQCKKFENQCYLHFAGKKQRRGNRFLSNMSTLMSGGLYDPEQNAFYIGAAALGSEMTEATSRETLLGSVGAHIGHELSHGYDLMGSQRDADGKAPLFTEKDKTAFSEKAKAITEKISRIEILNGMNVNGEKVINELLADMTGLSLSLELAKKTENFNYDAMFRAYAHFYRVYYRDRETMTFICKNEIHPVPYVRVNYVVSQFDEFYKTYPSVKEGTPMYVAPEDRVLIW